MRYVKQSVCLFLLAAVWGAVAQAQAQQMEVLDLAGNPIAASLSADDIVPVNCCDSALCAYPGWYVTGDAIFLHRSKARQHTLIVSDNGSINNTDDDTALLDAADLGFDEFETGYRVTIGRSVGHGLALEGSFFKVSEWDEQLQVTSNGTITNDPLLEGLSPPLANSLVFYKSNPFDTEQAGTFYQALQQTVLYQSDLQSSEFNVRASWQHCQFQRSEFFGVRYIQVRENFLLTSQDEVDSTINRGIGTYSVDCDNDLLGAQYGQELGFQFLGCAQLSARLKTGLFCDVIEQRTRIIDNNIQRYDNIDYEAALTFMGELNVGLNIKVTELLSVRGGYNFLWLEGVSLAAEQDYPIAFTGVTDNNNRGGLFYHGFSVGVQLSR